MNFPDTARYFRHAQVTGIPVRPDFFNLPSRSADAAPHLLVFGGSQGARVLNRILPQIAANLFEAVPGLTILHQCGARHVESTEQAYGQIAGLRERWSVQAFLDDMPQRFAEASLVLCRSGASTVAELAAAAKPSLLVPFPQAADDHQRRNAEVLVNAGAAVMMLESELTAGRVVSELIELLRDTHRLAGMGRAARGLAHPDAAGAIAMLLKENRGRVDRVESISLPCRKGRERLGWGTLGRSHPRPETAGLSTPLRSGRDDISFSDQGRFSGHPT